MGPAEATGFGWVPLDRSRIGALANELAGGPSGGPGVAAAAAVAARLSESPEQGLSGQHAPAAAHGAAPGVGSRARSGAPAGSHAGGRAGWGDLTLGEQEAAALQAAGLNTRGVPARPAKRPRRGRGTEQADCGAAGPGVADPGRASCAGAALPAARNVLLWLRQDMRLHDNPALAAAARDAARAGGVVAFIFVSSPEEDGEDLHSGACDLQDGSLPRAWACCDGRQPSQGAVTERWSRKGFSWLRPASQSVLAVWKLFRSETFLPPLLPSPAAGTSWRPAGASLFWLQEALRSLDADLRAKFGAGAGVLFRRGPYLPALQQAAAELGVCAIYMGRRCPPDIARTSCEHSPL